jgi:hypothetical protein
MVMMCQVVFHIYDIQLQIYKNILGFAKKLETCNLLEVHLLKPACRRAGSQFVSFLSKITSVSK